MHFELFAIILTTTYCVVLIFLLIGWRKALQHVPIKINALYGISVIVPVRNEELNLISLLSQLEKSTYPLFEVIVVDDHSTDGTFEIVQQWIAGKERFRCIKSSGQGKKLAITSGIGLSKHPIVLTTDGDCLVHDQWLFRVNESFQNEKVMLAFGGVAIQGERGIFKAMQAIEFSSLIGSGAALWAQGYPVMCNGANLAFRKSAFEMVQGYEGNLQVPSGDDEFLMRKIVREFQESVVFINAQDAVVITTPKASLSEFMKQRFRWAGKWKYNDSIAARFVAVYVFAIQVIFISAYAVLLLPLEERFKIIAVAILLLRALGEIVFLKTVCRFLMVRWRWEAFILLQLFYPIYVVVTGLFSNFMPVTWKNRRIL